MTGNVFMVDPELEARLIELGARLDVPEAGSLPAAVRARLDPVAVSAPGDRELWRRRALVAAAVVVAILTVLCAYSPTRTALADWLGIGAVRFTSVAQLPTLPPNTAAATPAGSTGSTGSTEADAMAHAQAQVTFPIQLPDPHRSGPVLSLRADPTVPGGLVSVGFADFDLTEIAAEADQGPVVSKFVGPDTHLRFVTVNSRDGAWISGSPHELAYLDPDGTLRTQTLRRAGNVLVWEQGGVTYRVEGLDSLDDALAVAATIG